MARPGTLTLTHCVVDLEGAHVLREGSVHKLTTTETRLLSYLSERPNQVVTREQLLDEVWGYSADVVSRAVDATVNRLRVKIERDPADPDHLLTVWGSGYRLRLADATTPRPSPLAPGRLEPDLDRFFGRGTETRSTTAALDNGRRLVTLVGPAGAGKTRLAREVGRSMADRKPGGTWFVPFEEATGSAGLEQAARRALGLQSQQEHSAIGPWLARRAPSLLIADNLEQALDAASQVLPAWLAAAPNLQILATSREPMGVAGEVVVDIGSLDEDAALALFADRAGPAGSLASQDERITRLLQRLDALPLSVELAAGLTEILSVDELTRRLDEMLDLLSTGRRDRPLRHASLRTAIAGSVEVLQQDERDALVAASVFRGGFTIESAEAVIGLESGRTFGLLRALRRRSMLHPVHDRTGRLALYVAVRAFAEEMADTDSARAAARQRHAEWFASKAGDLVGPFGEPPEDESHAWLIDELDNITAAFEYELTRDPVRAAALAQALHAHYAQAGPVDRALEVLEAALAVNPNPDLTRGTLLRSLAAGLWYAGRRDEVEAVVREAIDIARATGEVRLESRALTLLGGVAATRHQTVEAERLYRTALALQRASGDNATLAATLGNLATAIWANGMLDEARATLVQARALDIQAGNVRRAAINETQVGYLDGSMGRMDDARKALHRSIETFHRGGHRYHEAWSILSLGDLELNYADDPLTALELVQQAIALNLEHGSRFIERRAATLSAWAHWFRGEPRLADEVLTIEDVEPFPSMLALLRLVIDIDLGRHAIHRSRWLQTPPAESPLPELRRLTGLAWLAWKDRPEQAAEALELLYRRQAELGMAQLAPTAVLHVLQGRVGQLDGG